MKTVAGSLSPLNSQQGRGIRSVGKWTQLSKSQCATGIYNQTIKKTYGKWLAFCLEKEGQKAPQTVEDAGPVPDREGRCSLTWGHSVKLIYDLLLKWKAKSEISHESSCTSSRNSHREEGTIAWRAWKEFFCKIKNKQIFLSKH